MYHPSSFPFGVGVGVGVDVDVDVDVDVEEKRGPLGMWIPGLPGLNEMNG